MPIIYKTIIVDDELHGRENLSVLINDNISELNIVATAKDAFEAKALIEALEPDLVFLDINLGKVNGIDLLSFFPRKKFEVIFVTAYDKYALKALRAGAFGYILKPIILEELVEEVARLIIHIKNKASNLKTLKEEVVDMHFEEFSEKIMINHSKGYFFINTSDVVRLEAAGSYCKLFVNTGEIITVSKTLKVMTEQLNPEFFYRIHKTHIINLNYVKEYKSVGDGSLILKDNTEIKVAVLKRAEFKQKLITFMK